MKPISENTIEQTAIEILQSQGWEFIPGLALAPGALTTERESFERIILVERLRKSLAVLNPDIPDEARESALRKILLPGSPDMLYNNEVFHSYLVEKIKIPYQLDGYERSHDFFCISITVSLNFGKDVHNSLSHFARPSH